MESTLPKGLPRSGMPPGGTYHEYIVRDYQLPVREIGQGLLPLQRRGHYPFGLLAGMVEHADGDGRRKRPEVELPAFILTVSYSSPPCLRCSHKIRLVLAGCEEYHL